MTKQRFLSWEAYIPLRLHLHPALELPGGSSPKLRSLWSSGTPRLAGSWRAQPGRRRTRRASPSAARLGPGAPPSPRGCPSLRPAQALARVHGPAGCGRRGKWLAPLAAVAEAGFPREAAGAALHSLTVSGHAIGRFAIPARRGSRWLAWCPSRGEWRLPTGAGG